jgi:hypothetical protein
MSRSLHSHRTVDGYNSRRPTKYFHRNKKYTHRCERRNQRAQVEAALEDHQEYLQALEDQQLERELDQQFREESYYNDPDDWVDEWEEAYDEEYYSRYDDYYGIDSVEAAENRRLRARIAELERQLGSR